MTDLTIKEKLYAPLTIDSRRGRGGTYDYVKWQAVADRMNEIFGMNWSSHVVYENINEYGTIVTVRVAVCAKDPISNEQYCQEGYGASQIRDTDEPGSGHKGAYSKALKDACKRWGIGLHLEDGAPAAAPASIPSGYMGRETAPAPAPPAVPSVMVPTTPVAPVAAPAAAPMIPSAPINVAPTPVAPVTQAAPVANHPTAAPVAPVIPTAEMGLPATPAPAGVNPTAPVPVAPPLTPAPSVTPVPAAPAMAPVPAAVNTADTPGSITSVQDMAIQNLARLNGPEGTTADTFLQGLVEDPECALNRKVTSLNELSYNEAVCVIKAAKSL